MVKIQIKQLIFRVFHKLYKIKRPEKLQLNIDLFKEELPFIIVITSFNNKNYFKENLNSVLCQNYNNFKVIYIDDNSTDGTAQLVENYIKEFDRYNKVALIKNNVRKKKLENLYECINNLQDDEIIIELDGDDYFKDSNVLRFFNAHYQKNNSLIVYANYVNTPHHLAQKLNLEIYSSKTPNFILQFKLARYYPWIYSGIRSYYVKLFKKIKKEDLLVDINNIQKFYPVCHDMAIFYPMLEMAGKKVSYISDPLLLRNIDSPINDFKSYDNMFRVEIMKKIRSSKLY